MIITNENNYKSLDEWLIDKKKILLVCDSSIKYLDEFNRKLGQINVPVVVFSEFQPNPLYESVIKGVDLFRRENCDCIIAVGGGSAIDVAKCIKLYFNLDGNGEAGTWLNSNIIPNKLPFLVMPTTAGTGSEATRFAVIYFEGKKQSITSESIIPDTVLFDPSVLKTLPLYQKKSTMCDALCHAIESYWSVNSTEESKSYSEIAIKEILKNADGYLSNTMSGNSGMLFAAHQAGKAINITQTTAGHAMCYKITSLYGISHGHAAILCDRILFPWMINNIELCVDLRGQEYLEKTLCDLGVFLGGSDSVSGAAKLELFFKSLNFDIPIADDYQINELNHSVNPVRLKNHPILLDEESINFLYHNILRCKYES